ncbi:LysR family transcriptional regulator [Novosphingobium sp.]|jgi:DNA-binding transcriptional LysR family regulator|uniref:LysR family transcriptional regulator n=1 Tax=Novosphingobium sp. TaxID=1874826 RepID=UPI002FE34052
METKRLSYFLRIAQDGSLTRSANVLRIAQPALSRQMRLLEEELGLKLFTRFARGMALTDEGTMLRDAIAGPMRELELAIERIRTASRQSQSNIAIGIPVGLTALLSTPLALHLAATSSASRVIEGPHGSLVDWLARGMIDLALLEEPTIDPRLNERPVLNLNLALVGRADDPLMARSDEIAFAELARLPMILSSHHMGLRPTVNAAADRTGIELNVRFHADSARLVCDLVLNQLGYGILPPWQLDRSGPDARSLAFRTIRDPALPVTVLIASRRMRSANSTVAALETDLATFVQAIAR